MATATIALVSESLAAGGGRQLLGVGRGAGQGAEGSLGAQRLDRASHGPSWDHPPTRHAGRRRSGSARLWPPLCLQLPARGLQFPAAGRGGPAVGCPAGSLRGGTRFAEVGRQLSRRPAATGSP